MTDINIDSTVTLINSMIPVLVTMALLAAVMGYLGKVKF